MSTEVHSEQAIIRVPTGIWDIDPAHSSVEFQIKHMMIATVKGRFTDFEGTIVAAPDIADSSVRGVVRTASVDTNEPTRDAHLRSADFFDADHYPEITFESTRNRAARRPAIPGRRRPHDQGDDPRDRPRVSRRRLGARPVGQRPDRAQRPRCDRPQGLRSDLADAARIGRFHARRRGEDRDRGVGGQEAR